MNFLSHYYFERFSHNPELAAGSILPDMVKNANKNLNLHPHKHEEQLTGNYKLEQLFLGWRRHVTTDRIFHNSTFFYEKTHALKVNINPIVQGTEIRASFLSHIALELLLDHLLLIHNQVHEDSFYRYLNKTDRDSLRLFLNHCGVEDTRFFFRFYEQFIQEKYVSLYRNMGQISQALTNICYRLWPVPLTANQQNQLVIVLDEYAGILNDDYMDIFDDISRQLLALV